MNSKQFDIRSKAASLTVMTPGLRRQLNDWIWNQRYVLAVDQAFNAKTIGTMSPDAFCGCT